MAFEFITEIIGRIEAEAPDDLLRPLKDSLKDSINAEKHTRPPSAVMIQEEHGVPVDALIYFDILLKKSDAAQFLISIGYDQSEIAIKRQLLRKGRYFDRYGRQLLTHKNTNVYTYAELVEIIGRPLILQQFEEAVGKLEW